MGEQSTDEGKIKWHRVHIVQAKPLNFDSSRNARSDILDYNIDLATFTTRSQICNDEWLRLHTPES